VVSKRRNERPHPLRVDSGSFRPPQQRWTPILARCVRISRHKLHVQVRHLICDHPHVDTLRALSTLKKARHSAGRSADGLRFRIVELAESRNVPFWLDHDLSSICRRARNRMDVTHVNETVFKEHATFRLVSEAVFLADEAID